MPRVNLPHSDRYLMPRSGSKLSALLLGQMKANGLKAYELEAKLGRSAPYLRKMLRTPESCPLDDVRRLAVTLGISKTEFCNAWGW